MTDFNTTLIRALALGPMPSGNLLKLMEEAGGYNNDVRKAYEELKNRWSDNQKRAYEESRELLYAAVMLRAAASMVQSGQGVKDRQEDRMVETEICFKITSSSAHIEVNRKSDGSTGHEAVNKYIPTSSGGGGAAPRILVATFGEAEDKFAMAAIREFSRIGFACPPD